MKKWFRVLALGMTSLLFIGGSVDAGVIRSGFDSTDQFRNDDGFEGPVAIGFDINFFGQTFNSLFVNTNGNVTFDSGFSTFTPSGITGAGDAGSGPIIAPFFADVDTLSVGEPVRYGTGTVDGRAAFGVNWVDVAAFPSVEPLNRFQLVLTDRSDIRAGDFDIEFNYEQILWELGTASGGVSASVGYSNAAGSFFQLDGSLVNGAFLDDNLTTGLINNSLNSPELGRYLFEARNGNVGNPGGTVPEPSTLAIFAVMGLIGCRRLRRSRDRTKSA
ncbi:hypothetical protein Poly51_21120 [Rubripirellula tenax]|uniref:Uncharacterized protein n=1 Tax=Rubripirellula tenax TaxID=2528015 RepID=A0A5C6FGL3_9BACT|nr:nidogen-like domain-containing protein [Rubripirellula tenax]TWU59324.1 hypothetical protein Poly51_21120 [Rubripirellula tenax]